MNTATDSPQTPQPKRRSSWLPRFSISSCLALMVLAAAGYRIYARPEILEENLFPDTFPTLLTEPPTVAEPDFKVVRQIRRGMSEEEVVNAGWWMLYDPEERPRLRGAYRQGAAVGVWESWYPSGATQVRAACRDGQRHGAWLEWHDNGAKKREMTFVADQAEGAYRTWHADGTPECEGTFTAGQRTGRWTWWDDQGRKRVEGTYENGRRSSDWAVWDEHQAPVVENLP